MLMKIAHHNDGKEKWQSHTCYLFNQDLLTGFTEQSGSSGVKCILMVIDFSLMKPVLVYIT